MKKVLLFLFVALLGSSTKNGYCDIKGSINNPGVYEIKENYTIQDVINISGGLTKDAYTDNINLSKKVVDEMVIYISSKKEINTIESLNNCDCNPIYINKECKVDLDETKNNDLEIEDIIEERIVPIKGEKEEINEEIIETIEEELVISSEDLEDNRININDCSKEELITLNGLGLKKAEKIIEYRNNYGPFLSIEDIMKVSGIGESLFNQIKEYIKV